jgi:hypothetical protein
MDIDLGVIQRTKETQSLNVVHMKMRQEDIDTAGFRWELCSETADTGTGIENQYRTVISAHLDSRGVSAISARLNSGSRQ